ncbi:NAD-dependent epimerase/dehydratase family protein [Pseudaestuariivita rosea]|uniref:NAD-dependent epimerase/dehydratase family protein n=1 Tax=Pseudaestuariivita rosea TaxID=2763263 RepID=UPI001ABB8222|nr:NAD(P)-dependent oxidoreductase [Pseudaestuariivita rosea]
MRQKTVVFGASGRLGRMLQKAWRGKKGIIWQSRHAIAHENALQADFCDPTDALLHAASSAGAILNLAGLTRGTHEDLQLNTKLAIKALQFAKQNSIPRVILMSSAAVYGATREPADETAMLHPLSDYAKAKIEMEQAVNAWCADNPGIDVIVLRLGNVAGSDSLPLSSDTPISLDRFPSGKGPLRSYIGPMTLAEVLKKLCATKYSNQQPLTLNIAAPQPVYMQDLLNAADQDWHFTEAPETAVEAVVLSTQKLQSMIKLPGTTSQPEVIVDEWRAQQ